MKYFKIAVLALAPTALAAIVLVTVPVSAKPLGFKVPDETAALKPGEGMDVAQNNCMACHSVDYIQTQPRGPNFKKNFWQAEVTKMIKVYGAPIEDADAAKIVDYLTANY